MTRLRSALALLTLAAATVVALSWGGPAQAGPGPCPNGWDQPPCAEHFIMPVTLYDGCEQCPEGDLAISFVEYSTQPVQDVQGYTAHVADGLALLHKAAVTTDPQAALWLRQQAFGAFGEAAAVLGTSTFVKPGAVGYFDAKTGTVSPRPMPLLTEAGAYIAEGLAVMTRPEPEPARELFDLGYLRIREHLKA